MQVKTWSVDAARANFTEVLGRAQRGEVQALTVDGRPQVALVDYAEFRRLVAAANAAGGGEAGQRSAEGKAEEPPFRFVPRDHEIFENEEDEKLFFDTLESLRGRGPLARQR